MKNKMAIPGDQKYTKPYGDHEAMCSVKQSAIKGGIGVGSKSVKEGRKPNLANKGKGFSSKHGDRGYQTPKVKHK